MMTFFLLITSILATVAWGITKAIIVRSIGLDDYLITLSLVRLICNRCCSKKARAHCPPVVKLDLQCWTVCRSVFPSRERLWHAIWIPKQFVALAWAQGVGKIASQGLSTYWSRIVWIHGCVALYTKSLHFKTCRLRSGQEHHAISSGSQGHVSRRSLHHYLGHNGTICSCLHVPCSEDLGVAEREM